MFMFILINNIGLIPGAHPGTGTVVLLLLLVFMYVGAKKMGIGYIPKPCQRALTLCSSYLGY